MENILFVNLIKVNVLTQTWNTYLPNKQYIFIVTNQKHFLNILLNISIAVTHFTEVRHHYSGYNKCIRHKALQQNSKHNVHIHYISFQTEVANNEASQM